MLRHHRLRHFIQHFNNGAVCMKQRSGLWARCAMLALLEGVVSEEPSRSMRRIKFVRQMLALSSCKAGAGCSSKMDPPLRAIGTQSQGPFCNKLSPTSKCCSSARDSKGSPQGHVELRNGRGPRRRRPC